MAEWWKVDMGVCRQRAFLGGKWPEQDNTGADRFWARASPLAGLEPRVPRREGPNRAGKWVTTHCSVLTSPTEKRTEQWAW